MDWNAVVAVATVVLVIVGTWQVIGIRSQAKKERTLNAVTRYDSDPTIDNSTRRLRDAQDSGDYLKSPRRYRPDVVNLLNYLDTIAIGIDQNLYVEGIARDHIEPILLFHCEEYLNETQFKALSLKLDDFRHLNDLKARWQKTHTHFRDGLLRWKRRS